MDFFRDSSNEDTTFFDEGPTIKARAVAAINTSSIDTSEIDAYRQGVNITQQKHYDAGTVKISAGEPGHVLRANRFGMTKLFRTATSFQDLDYFDPVAFMNAQSQLVDDARSTITLPIIIGDNDQIENFNMNGVIEPFPIRNVVAFTSLEASHQQPRSIKAAMMCGNTSLQSGCDQIRTVDKFNDKGEMGSFFDLANVSGSYTTIGFFVRATGSIDAFADERVPAAVSPSTTHDSGVIAALSLMTGSTENYIGPDKRSATSGWTYSNNRYPGTDSLSFGGQTH